jgi:hypothetical protein
METGYAPVFCQRVLLAAGLTVEPADVREILQLVAGLCYRWARTELQGPHHL